MYLKALRVKGFKSFARATELVFEPGVGVIIGPNGSGKSNIADAVIWALGEQSPSTVRGSSMQDVIFAGSDGRRASGSAEVELTFDNGDGALPLPTPEVSIMRRVARDGSSQYFINQSGCRLTDVVELMAQVGLGKELHSIIGQGKVEGFLAGQPEDRRSQIEEAAGLGTFKRRRERAELKLREVRRNLERAEMLEREVGSQLAPLRRQANAAEQMRDVQKAVAETRGRVLTGEVAVVDDELALRNGEMAAVQETRARCEEGLESSPSRGRRRRRRSRADWRSGSGAPSGCCAPAFSTAASRAVAGWPSSDCGCSRRWSARLRRSAIVCSPSSPGARRSPTTRPGPTRSAGSPASLPQRRRRSRPPPAR